MNFLLLILYIFLGTVIVIFSSQTIKQYKTWSVKLWVQIWLGVYYILIPVLFIAMGKYGGRWPDLTIKDRTYTNFQTFYATALFLLSFYITISLRFKKYIASPRLIKFGIYKGYFFKALILLMLGFGVFSLLYYVLSLGGFVNAFKIAPYLGSPYFEDIYSKRYSGLFTIFKRFIPILIYSALIFKFYKRKSSLFFLAVIPFLLFVYYTFLERQRQITLMIFIIPMLGYMVEKEKFVTKNFLIYLGILIFLFPTITFLNKAFVYNKSSYEIITSWFDIEKYIKEFNFAQISLYLSQKADYSKFLFADFIQGFYGNYLPTSLRTSKTVNDLNSFLFLGVENRSIPPGIIANSFYHLGYWGSILWGALLGFVVNVFEWLWRCILDYDRRFSYAYVFYFMAFFAYIRTGVLGFSLYRPFFVFLILILLFSFTFRLREADYNR